MAKPRKTAAQLVGIITTIVLKDRFVRDDLKSDPTLKLNIGRPTRREPDGRCNWEIRYLPTDIDHAQAIADAVEKVQEYYDLKE